MSLQVWLPLNRDLRNQGIKNIAATNNGATFSDGCANFIYSQYIQISCLDYSKLTSCSLSFWIKIPQNDGNWLPFTGQSTSYYLMATSNGTGSFYHNNAGGSKTIYKDGVVATTPTNDGQWHHYCITDVNLSTWTTILINHYGSDNNWNWNGQFYDFRIYDHALSKKEVAELSRGCVLHYPMNDTLNESTVNLSSTPSNNGSATSAYAWDQTKHADAIKPGGSWSVGYNSGVEEPTIGYHAYWKMMDGVPTMVFTDMNSDIGYPHRWIGISDYSQLLKTIGSNTTYTVSFEAKADRENMYVHGGLYYKRTADEGYGFRDGSSYTKLSTNWQRYSYTKTTQTVYDVNSIYIYGIQDGNTQRLEGICYVRNFQVEIKDHATPYTPTSRTQQYLKDVSGFGNDATIINGALQVKQLMPNTGRYDKCVYFDGSTYTRTLDLPSERLVSYSFWIYLSSYIDRAIVFIGEEISKICFSFWGSNYLILAAGNSSAIPGARFNRSIIPLNKWTHIACNYKGNDHSTIELYVNGIKYTSDIAEWYSNVPYTNILNIGARNGGSISYTGVISDLRIYTTILSEEAIKDLYQTSLSIDKSQNGYCYELNESDAQSSVDVKKNGQLKCKNYSELFDGLYLPAGTYVDTLLYYSTSDKCKAETYIKYDANGSGRDLMGFSGAGAGYWGVKADGTWEMHNSTYTDADITKYNKIIFNYPNTSEYGNYKVGTLGSSTGYSVRNKTIYHVKLWKNDVLERDLYPCSINNQCGLIDGLTGIFYPANNSNANLVSGTVEAKIGKNGLVQANQMNEY